MSPRAKDLLILSAVCFLCFFWRLGSVGLFDFNEGFYTQVAREMYLRGDFITPRVNGILFFDKPPLALWLSAISFSAFGVSEFAARLPVALVSSALVFLTYLFGSRLLSRTAGLIGGAALALNPLFYGTARQMTMDIHQSLWFAVALFSFFAAWERGRRLSSTPPAQKQSGTTEANPEGAGSAPVARHGSRLTSLYYHLFWAACGLGVLAKSVPGLFPLAVAFTFVAVTERFRWRGILARIWEAKILTGMPLMLGVIVPWFYLAWRANGHVFYEEFWLLHHVQLARGGDFNHAQPIWYYLPALAAGMFPWSLFLPWAIWALPGRAVRERPAQLFLVVWLAVVFLLFTAMKSKLVSYLLPMYPAAALLVGDWLARVVESTDARALTRFRWSVAAAAVLSVVALAAGMGFAQYVLTSPHAARQRQDIPAGVIDFGVHALVVVAIGLTAAAIVSLSRGPRDGVWTLAGGLCGFIALADVEGLNAIESHMNGPLQSLARETGRLASDGTALAINIGQPRRPSVLFYLPPSSFVGKPLPAPGQDGIILERGETEPVERFLDMNRPAYILTDRKRADVLLAQTPSLRVVDQRDRWLLLHAPAQAAFAQRPNGLAGGR